MTKRSTMKWGFTGDLMVSMATAGPVEDRVWDEFVDDLLNKPYKRHLAAALSSVEVSSLQRKKASDAFKKRSVPVAVVTDEALVRGVVTAVSWLGVNIKSYTWADLEIALAFLEIPKSRNPEILMFINVLKNRVIAQT